MVLEIYETAVKELVEPTATLEQIGSGFQFIEGPVWHVAEECLFFSDIPANTMYRYSVTNGIAVYRQPSHFSNGLTLDGSGHLLACEHQRRRVSRTTAQGVETVVDRYQGKRLNSPNDLIVTRDGSILFTDPHYGLLDGLGGPGEQELPFRGVYRIAPGANEPTLLVDDFTTPNGLALSADERRLYIDDTVEGHIRAFDVQADWTLTGGAVLTDMRGDAPGVPDGMKLNTDGTIFCTGPGGIWIIAPTGVVLGRISMPEVAANLAWGDADGSTLYITANTGLYRLRCRVGGRLPWNGNTK
ncbi:MAG: SMP-30/gluconolactonase/LRE family protein [Caldilineaceae bacterium]